MNEALINKKVAETFNPMLTPPYPDAYFGHGGQVFRCDGGHRFGAWRPGCIGAKRRWCHEFTGSLAWVANALPLFPSFLAKRM